MTIELFWTGLLQGALLAFITYAVMIPFRILNFPDLTAEGSYPFAGAICTLCLLHQFHPISSIFCAAIAGGIMGVGTSLLHLRLNVNTLLAGIILSAMAYSVNLRLLGKPNIALFDFGSLFVHNNLQANILIVLCILSAIVLPLYLFLKTEIGLRLRAVGLNQDFATRQGISRVKYTILALFLSGCFTGFSGGLIVQLQSYMDVSMGVGIVIHALAALMIGEQLMGNKTLKQQFLAPLVGALVYQQIQGIALTVGLSPSDLKFFTGAVLICVIWIHRTKE